MKKSKILIFIMLIVFASISCIYGKFERVKEKRPLLHKPPMHKEENKIDRSLDDGSISDSIFEVLQEYPDFARTINSGSIKLPNSETMIPQGIAFIKQEYIIITSYDYKEIENSKCYVLTLDGELVNEVTLDTKSHVGAIVYDEDNKVFFIPDTNGVLNSYAEEDIIKKNKANAIQKFDYIGEGLANYKSDYGDYIDFMCIKDQYLYVGNFRTTEKGIVKKYEINKGENGLTFNFSLQFNVPTLIQGMDFYKYNDKEYMILSRSFGRRKKSKLEIYEYDENIKDYSDSSGKKIKMKLPPMLEQITVDGDNLLLLFESNAKKYADGKDKIDVLCILSLEKILEAR